MISERELLRLCSERGMSGTDALTAVRRYIQLRESSVDAVRVFAIVERLAEGGE